MTSGKPGLDDLARLVIVVGCLVGIAACVAAALGVNLP